MDGWGRGERGGALLLLPLCTLSDVNRLPSWERGHLLAGVASSTDTSTFSEGGSRESLAPGFPTTPQLGKLITGW